ncbi:hypothetical protein H0A64_09970, partial [Alcaligenaceae bacterium]|nr:hypothetical protein [Alcaligenaceae bacterium]
MTIDSSVRRAGPFAGNGSTVDFPFEFKVFGREDIRVTVADPDNVEIVLQLDSDYSVIVNPDQAQAPGGTVTYPISGSPLPVGHKLVLTGALSYEQPTAITNLGGFYPKVLEDALDRATIQIQQLEEEVNRSIKIGVADGIPADEYRDSLLEAAADAVAAASAAQTSESNAHDSEEAAALSAGAALVSEGKAHDSEEAAALSESNAHDSEEAAALSAGAALVSEGKAHDSEEAAALSESNAHDS